MVLLNNRRTVAVLLAVSATLPLNACSNDNDEAASTKPAPTSVAPAELSWQSQQGIKVPTNKDNGPTKGDVVRFGFSHDPQGAVLAAINAQVLMATAGDSVWPSVTQVLAAGKGRDQWAQYRALVSVKNEQISNPASFKGYKFTDYSDKSATLLLAVDYPEQGLAAYPVHLVWSRGDWLTVLPEQKESVDAEPLKSLDGFVKLKGNNDE